MPKMMLHDAEARAALARGIAKLTHAVSGTLGPKGMNAIIDRPIGAPIISRDGVSIADEVELECPFENMGAQVLREVARQTNEVAGDGTTTATVLADALVQHGLAAIANSANPVELVQGLELAVTETINNLKRLAQPLRGGSGIGAVAAIAANDKSLGEIVAEAFERAGPQGIVDVQLGVSVATRLEVVEGMAFDRGYLSHHMVTEVEKMQVVLDNPLILITDQKILSPKDLEQAYAIATETNSPLLIIADEVAPACIVDMLGRREKTKLIVAAVNPPEFGHWRKAMLEDVAIAVGGKVIARDLGGSVETCEASDLGSAQKVRISADRTLINGGHGEPAAIAARREQIKRQYEAAPENIERDKFQQRLAKLSGGTAVILAGGATPVEQKRRLQLIEDAINATRAALEEGIVPGGGLALLRAASQLDALMVGLKGGVQQGAQLLQSALRRPFERIAANCGLNPEAQFAKVMKATNGVGLDARSGELVDLLEVGIVDPVRVSCSAVRNAASVAGLVLTTQTLIAKRPDEFDPTSVPARGGGAEQLGRP